MPKRIDREDLISKIAFVINQIKLPYPVRVAVDGAGNAGKTTFANELSNKLSELGRKVIRSTIDSFHYPAKIRYKKGKYSPRGYLEDSYNYPLLKKYILDPLGPKGNLFYKDSIYNFKIDEPTNVKFKKADRNSILLFDGIFLLNDELVSYWDYKLYIDATFENTMERAISRDSELFGGTEKVKKLYERRYIPGHRMYLSLFNPIKASDIVIDNNNYQNPFVTKISKIKYNNRLVRFC